VKKPSIFLYVLHTQIYIYTKTKNNIFYKTMTSSRRQEVTELAAEESEHSRAQNTASYAYGRSQGAAPPRERIIIPTDGLKTKEQFEKYIDAIDPRLVASVLIDTLHRNAPECALSSLDFMLDSGNGALRPLSMKTRENQNLYDGGTRGTAHEPEASVQKVIEEYLLKHVGLFEDFDTSKKEVQAYAGAFFVRKEKELEQWQKDCLRVIVDARPANTLTPSESFQMSPLDDLLHVLQNLSEYEIWYAVYFDWRHEFHQIPIAEYLKPYCVIHIGNGRYVAPRAAPMGMKSSPKAGHGLTWALLLAKSDSGPDRPDISAESDISEELLHKLLHVDTETPSWVPFKKGGGISAIIDGGLAVSPSKDVILWWQNRIVTQTRRFHVTAKLQGSQGDEIAPMVELRRYEGLPTSATPSVEYSGIKFAHHHRCRKGTSAPITVAVQEHAAVGGGGAAATSKSSNRQTEPLPPGVSVNEAEMYSVTHRDLSAALGKINWDFRIAQTSRQAAQPLRKLYQYVTPETQREWDDVITLDRRTIGPLLVHWKKHLENAWIPSVVVAPVTTFAYGAADAAGASDNQFERPRYRAAVYIPDIDQLPQIDDLLFDKEASSLHHIALDEAGSTLLTVRLLIRNNSQARCLIIVIDSLTAKAWIEQGYAECPFAFEIVQKIHAALQDRRLYLVYVPSRDNLADTPTRDAQTLGETRRRWTHVPSDRRRLDATILALRRGRDLARSTWSIAGGQVGGAPREEDTE
jgi:hypothetical protein